MKRIKIHGQCVQLYSLDGGHTWSTSRQSIAAYRQLKTMLRLELQKRFERADGMQDPDPNNITELETIEPHETLMPRMRLTC